MTYELWDNVSGNIIDVFATEADTVGVVRVYLDQDGADHVRTLGVRFLDERDETQAVYRGDQLLTWVNAHSVV